MFAPIDTPAVLVDLDIAEKNIQKFQAYCDAYDLKLRPHIKTHKLPLLAHAQIKAGAVGITCQKISEAEVMISEGGIDDVLITFNIIGSEKLSRLRRLSDKVKLSVVADNATVAAGLSDTFARAPKPLDVLVECDTGAKRCGVTSPDAAADLAVLIDTLPGLNFAGLMTYPPTGNEVGVQAWLVDAVNAISKRGLVVDVISNGGSPGMWQAQDVPVATEYRIGTYIYNDRSLQAQGVCTWDDCALSVLATVVSVPSKDRAVIDCGTKVLTSDLLGQDGNGYVLGRPDINVAGLSEEHGVLTALEVNLCVGDRIRIIPNHACVVSNMLDEVVLVRQSEIIAHQPVRARGKVW